MQGLAATLAPFLAGGKEAGEEQLRAAEAAAARVKYEESPTKTSRNLHFRTMALRGALKRAIRDSMHAHSVSGGNPAAKQAAQQAAEAVDKLADALMSAMEQQHQFASLANMIGDQDAAAAMQRTAAGMRGYTPATLGMLSALAYDADLRSMMRSVLRIGDGREGKRARSPSPPPRDRSDTSGYRGGGGGGQRKWRNRFQRTGGASGSGSGEQRKDAKPNAKARAD
jgi:hypothetical protein